MSAKEFEGKFADYMRESDTVHDIELDVGGKKPMILPVPTRARVRDFEKVMADPDLGQADRGEQSWQALLGDDLAAKVFDYFDDKPFHEFYAFRDFVWGTWFGRGADDVPGK